MRLSIMSKAGDGDNSSKKGGLTSLFNRRKRKKSISSDDDNASVIHNTGIDIDVNSTVSDGNSVIYDKEEEIDIDADSTMDDDLEFPSNEQMELWLNSDSEPLETIDEESDANFDRELQDDDDGAIAGQISFHKEDDEIQGHIEFPHRDDAETQGQIEFPKLSDSPFLDDLLGDADSGFLNVITSIRAKKGVGTGLNVHAFGSNLRNLLKQGSTENLYVPCLSALMRELNTHKITNEQLQQALHLMQNWRRGNKLDALRTINPELPKFLGKMLNTQYLKNQDNAFSLYATEPELKPGKRFNYLGLGSITRHEYIAVLKNAILFSGTQVTQDGKSFVMTQTTKDGQQVKLIEGKIEGGQLALTIPSNTPANLRYDAIARLMFVIASHTQQNNNNTFTPSLGDDGVENAIMLYLAFYKYRLNIKLPGNAEEIIGQIAASDKLDEAQKQSLINGLQFIFTNSQMFSETIDRKGNKIIEHYPTLPDSPFIKMNTKEINNTFKNQLSGMHSLLDKMKKSPNQVNEVKTAPNAAAPAQERSENKPIPRKP